MLGPACRPVEAGYKARRWEPGAPESYPARLLSEGVTIAVHTLYNDELAAKVFDAKDMVTRGIIPLALVIFNDNDSPVVVEASAIELIYDDNRLHTLLPGEAVSRVFQKGKKSVWLPQPIPRLPSDGSVDEAARNDFEFKFLSTRIVPAKGKASGFLYFQLPVKGATDYLRRARIYVPRIYRQDTGNPLIYFEIELEPSIVIQHYN